MNASFQPKELRFADPNIRLVAEPDSEAIARLFEQNYGDTYLAKDVYNGTWVKRCVYGENIIGLVIHDDGPHGDCKVVASGALMLSLGDFNDRRAELARLVVSPQLGGHGLGSRLVKALVEAAEESLDYAESHARTAHLHSQHMLEENHFIAIGFLPQYVYGEHLVPYARLFGDAAKLRAAECPRIIPEAIPLAQIVLQRSNLPTQLNEVMGDAFPLENEFALRCLDSG